MKSLKSAARRGVLISTAALSALALASCSAGQVTQTAEQVAAVDGANDETENREIALRDVTVHVTPEGEAGLKFNVINQDTSHAEHSLESVSVDGDEVEFADSAPFTLTRDCVLIADLEAELDRLVEPEAGCVTHVATTVENSGFAVGGVVPVTFVFDTGELTVQAAISEPLPESGTFDREHERHETNEEH